MNRNEGVTMLRRLRASMMLTVIVIGVFTAIDIVVDTGLGDDVYSIVGMLIIFCAAFVVAPYVLRKLPLR